MGTWNETNDGSGLSPLTLLNDTLTLSDQLPFVVDFELMTPSIILGRNNVFLTFYTALLFVAQFAADDNMASFASTCPIDDVALFMGTVDGDCSVSLCVQPLLSRHPMVSYDENPFIDTIVVLNVVRKSHWTVGVRTEIHDESPRDRVPGLQVCGQIRWGKEV